ncbi:hypothetical protein [Sphingobacterium hungaricum]|uniref:Uncharacterized protein n=1 Tax=Sphingobacterium hungaricum TaxID=2082723 RepID=A0A928UZQ4_9SPHI|nr:hypothetical protein [Sphingobacterium hungaricum]MBE8714336.1 hypothetical protein [Sphingobacterium hungaricum]
MKNHVIGKKRIAVKKIRTPKNQLHKVQAHSIHEHEECINDEFIHKTESLINQLSSTPLFQQLSLRINEIKKIIDAYKIHAHQIKKVK